MSAGELIRTYSYIGDGITLSLCIALLMVIKSSLSFSDDIRFVYLRRAIHFVMFGSEVNMLFALFCEYLPNFVVGIFAAKVLYHLLLMGCLHIFVIYVCNLLGIDKEKIKSLVYLYRVFFGIGILADICSQITHFGFYYQDGLWYNQSFLRPFSLVYIVSVSIIAVMLLFFGKNMIKPIRHSLLGIATMMVVMLLFENALGSNTITTFTFAVPIIAVLILLHSKPFDVETGARGEKTLDSYLSHNYRKGYSIDFMVLSLDMRTSRSIPKQVGQTMYSFWHKYFKDVVFFSLRNGVYVLAIARNKHNGDTEAKARELIYEVFPKHYNKYKIQYKIVELLDTDFIMDSDELSDILNVFFDRMQINQVQIPDRQEIDKLRAMRVVRAELADIEKKHDLNDERVVVYCQPIRNAKTGKFETAESLMRLKSNEGELVPPGMFIPLAEKYGYIHTLSLIILNKVCVKIKEMMAAGVEFNRISVNFSIMEMREDSFCDEVINIIRYNEVPFEKIGIELTESQNESDYQYVRDKVKVLKEYGISLYLDDFGTGYSNFDRILKLGVDVIKFDRSLLLFADTDNSASFTLLHFSQAFKELQYTILFEGVENEEQEELCMKCGADYLQGFKYSKPVPVDELPEYFMK